MGLENSLICSISETFTWNSDVPLVDDAVRWPAMDIDGDGFADLMGLHAAHLYRPDGYLSAPYPEPTLGHGRDDREPLASCSTLRIPRRRAPSGDVQHGAFEFVPAAALRMST